MKHIYFNRMIKIFFIQALFAGILFAQSGKIAGSVTEVSSGDPVPGANVYFPNTSIGTTTDINGDFHISGVSVGEHTLLISYLGYKDTELQIVVNEDETLVLNIEMSPQAIAGDTVVVTAQAEGQWQAINQQLASKTVKNVVSRKQIQELPEANAAEAVGRLPGVSLERSGGEGNKVVIRGMASKYSLIQIDGVNMTATGEGDRSTDLSMISPYMLEGIELTKSIMANQEATATGGIVNFRIKKAPDRPSFNVIAQGGYNGLRGTYQDYKLSVGGSSRFFSKKLGAYAQVDYEEKDAGSQQMGGVSFSQDGVDLPVRTNSMQLMDIYRHVQRLGGTLVLDYALPSTDIKLTNFYSRIRREETGYNNNYGFQNQSFTISYWDTPKRWLTVLTNSLQLDQRWKGWNLNASFSHSYSENILPREISSTNSNSPTSPFPTTRQSNYNVNLDPETIPDSLNLPMDEAINFMHLGQLSHQESKIWERDLASELNLAYNFNIFNSVNVKLNLGAKVKQKRKDYDAQNFTMSGQYYLDLVYDTFEDQLSERSKQAWAADDQRLLLADFWDKDYDGGDFLDGRYRFSPVFDKDKFRMIDDLAMATYDPKNKSISLWDLVLLNQIGSNFYDYNGTETYYAFYLMPEINIGSDFLIVPGVRYEANRTEYTGYQGNRLGVLRDWQPTPIDTVTKVRKNEFVLPMIQTFYKPFSWLTFKAGYTHTLQRPNYNNIIPAWFITNQGQIDNLGNFRLKPELSRNWDLQISVHSDRIGLLTFGAFHKKITDMIFWTGQTVITDTSFFDLPSLMHRRRAAYAVNNPYDAINYGYEVEWQSNFWYLPGLLKGFVLNFNYTRNKSEAKYLRSVVRTIIDPMTYRATLISEDTTYTSPMISQPNHLLNLTLGYDYKGFSIRWAMRYKSNIFTSTNWYEKLRGYSTDFYRYDLAIKQKLPFERLEFFLNVNNLTGEIEKNVINHMNFANYIEDYGRSGNLGLRYTF